MLNNLFKWTCSAQNCEGTVVARHRPRACPSCRSIRTLRFSRRLRLKLRYLVCRKCEMTYATSRKIKRCICGHTKFKVIKHDEYFQGRSKAWRKATGRPASRGPIPTVDHFSNEGKRSHRRTVERRRR